MAKLGEMLIEEQLITDKQLQDALKQQEKQKGFLGDILMEMGAVDEKQLTGVLVRQTNSPFLDLTGTLIPKSMKNILSWNVARKHSCIPVKETGMMLHVAFVDPSNDKAVEAVGFATGKTIKTFISPKSAMRRAWDDLYGKDRDNELLAKSIDSMQKTLDKESDHRQKMSLVSKDYSGTEDLALEDDNSKLEEIDVNRFDEIVSGVLEEVHVVKEPVADKRNFALSVEAESAPIIKLVNGILIKALEMGACDIHFEPFETMLRIRFRIDGELHAVMRLPANIKHSMASRIKIMAELDIAERRIPQDGRARIKIGNSTSVEMRVSTLPSVYGEKIVLRILAQGNLKKDVSKLGFSDADLHKVQTALGNPYGMILVTGPTGSGKSTTLYTALNQLNVVGCNIVTAEDPAEYNLHGVTQVNVKPHIGYTFEMALRAFLRQDPDIIMVGEMRDAETANIATKAALTGHLVLSTLHTNDCPTTISRLLDLDIQPYMVAAAVKLIIAQRLVRKLCPHCKTLSSPKQHEVDALLGIGLSASEIQDMKAYEPIGCKDCNSIGYSGRLPVFEVLQIANKELKDAISEAKSPSELARIAKQCGMTPLGESAMQKVREGLTSLQEALKITLSE